MKIIITCLFSLITLSVFSQDSMHIILRSQYFNPLKEERVNINGADLQTDAEGMVVVQPITSDSLIISAEGYSTKRIAVKEIKASRKINIDKDFYWKDLLNPQFYIVNGGLWMILFIVFAETGLFAGFFLPGDALLFVTGIYSSNIITAALGNTHSEALDLLILGILISLAGIIGNFVGYWFGLKSGNFLFTRKDTFFFKKKYLIQAHDFYEKNGGGAIIVARFIPLVRTFAPIVAGIVKMDRKKFAYYNILGSFLWVSSMLLGGHFLQKFILAEFNFDLKQHLEVIVIGIVAITTLPVIWKIVTHKSNKQKPA